MNRKKFRVASNEAGVHLELNNHFANDLTVFEKSTTALDTQYFRQAPLLVIEVDLKVDLSETPFGGDLDYLLAKSKKLHEFGTEKLIWITTNSKKIFISNKHDPWQIVDFDCDIELLDGCVLNLAKLLLEEDIKI